MYSSFTEVIPYMVEISLIIHIGSGFIAIALGLIVMRSRKHYGIHTKGGVLYHWLMFAVCLTAVLLCVVAWPRIWWLLPVAIGSYALALLGYLSARSRWQNWLPLHVSCQGGSFIALITAFLIVNWEFLTGEVGLYSVWAWIIPTLVGTPIIMWVQREIALGRRPHR